jgi:hypothetical protein
MNLTNTFLLRILLLACLPICAPAQWLQRIQNTDEFFGAGPTFVKTQLIGGTNVTLYGSTGSGTTFDIGYHIMRKNNLGLWVEFVELFANSFKQTATIPGSISLGGSVVVPGVRLMVPVQSRISIFGAAGGGFGFFSFPGVTSDSPPKLVSNGASHGVFDAGAGVDFRLSGLFSIRVDVRDYVTGRDLDGVAGRNHILPVLGFVLHLK